jgi:methyl-accepting chemotaxis protein
LKNMKMMTKLLLGFGVVALIVLVVGYFGLSGSNELTASVLEIGTNRLPSSSSLSVILEAQRDVDSAENGLLARGTTAQDRKPLYDRFDAAQKRAEEARKIYEPLPQTKEEAQLWTQFVEAWNAWWKDHTSFVEMARQYDQTPSDSLYPQLVDFALVTEGVTFDRAQGLLKQLIQLQNDVGNQEVRNARVQAAQVHMIALVGMVAGPLLALLLGIFLALSISRPVGKSVKFAELIASGDLTQRLDLDQRDEIGVLAHALNDMSGKLRDMVATIKDSAQQVAASSEQISASSQSLAEGAQSQASTLEETSASMEELTASVDQVSEHAQSQAAAVEQGSSSMAQVQKSIDEISKSLAEISGLAAKSVENAQAGTEAVMEVVQGITLISESSEKIGGIVTVISDIADQTNLLALNASIEAARAGEHGRGFAVVADEVSKLADRSSASTKEIEGLIKESVKNVTRGVEIANGSQGAMEQIRIASQKVKDMIVGLTDSMQQQVTAIKELAKALESVSDMSQSISAATEQQSVNSKQVSKAVESVNELTQSAASSTEEMSTSSEQLSGMAQELQNMTEQFKVANEARSGSGAPQAGSALAAAPGVVTIARPAPGGNGNGNGKGKGPVFFPWSDAMGVKVGRIDDQHKRLVTMVNTLYRELIDRKGLGAQKKTIEEMVEYASTHFKIEEELMERFRFEGRNEHCKPTRRFARRPRSSDKGPRRTALS